jgi:hypothetical protein
VENTFAENSRMIVYDVKDVRAQPLMPTFVAAMLAPN